MTNEEHERLTRALVAKAHRFRVAGQSEDDWLHGVVATSVADTVMVVDGTMPIEALENEDWIREPQS